MKQMLSDMTVAQLVERFMAMALDQDDALLDGRHAKYNRLYDQMVTLETELRLRAGDQREGLLPLLLHPNAQVRLKAAIATLKAARAVLEEIKAAQWYPQALDAGMMLRALDDGSYEPT